MSTAPIEVAVVESDAAVAAAIGAALRRRGHRVTLVESGEAAAAMKNPDVLVCSVELEGMSGLDLLERLRERGSSVRTVFITSQPTHEYCRRAMQLGATDLLAKPFRLEELMNAVEADTPATAARDGEPTRTFHRSLLADFDNAERCVRELAAFLLRSGLGPSTRARIATACGEALDNTQRHAYPGEPGSVTVTAELDGRELVVRVVDQGVGFDPLTAAVGPMRDPAESGLARASALAEELRIESSPGRGTRIELRFFAFRVCFDEDDLIDLTELDWLPPAMARRLIDLLRTDESDGTFNLSPALAVSVGRMLASPTQQQNVQMALWS